jgi:adenylate cyclase
MFVTSKYKLKNVTYFSIIGTVAGAIIGFLLQNIDKIDNFRPTFNGLFIGFFVGIAIGLCEEFLFLVRFRNKTYLFLLLFRKLVYSFVFAFFLLFVNSATKFFTRNLSIVDSINSTLFEEHYFRDLIIIVIIAFFIIALLQIRRLHRPGDLIKYISGKYHRPEEIEKIFLFIDLKSSTSIAEKLGNLRYSEFLIDYYDDMTDAILMSKAEIYQYIGDEIVLTWSFAEGIKDARCIHCFFDIRNTMELNKERYLRKFDVYPKFKAAMHAGSVSVTWIGTIKKEVVYHGDVLNTTSRIQDECNEYHQYFLISDYMLKNIKLPEYLKAEFVGEHQLKGKLEKVNIFGLKGIMEK